MNSDIVGSLGAEMTSVRITAAAIARSKTTRSSAMAPWSAPSRADSVRLP